MIIKASILTLKPVSRKARHADWSDIDAGDIDPEAGAPYGDYSSPCIEPHPFGGGIPTGITEL